MLFQTLPPKCHGRNQDTDQATFFFNLLSNLGEFVQIVASDSCPKMMGKAPCVAFGAVAHLLQGSTCCPFSIVCNGLLSELLLPS